MEEKKKCFFLLYKAVKEHDQEFEVHKNSTYV